MHNIVLKPVLPTDQPATQISAELLSNAPNSELVANSVQDVVTGQLALYERTGAASPWIGYLGVDAQSHELLGSCSFIGKPEDGSVEIAYFTFPPYERRGVATAMAEQLLVIAQRTGNPALHAFTLPHHNPSTSVLKKLGFKVTGEAEDDDAGVVWKWERRQPD